MNRIVLIGRLTKDPELRYTSSNIPTASFSIAVDRPFTNQNGEREADFINIVAWRNQAENVKKYLTKGSQCAVEGRLQIRNYDDQNGQRRYITEVIADRVEFISSRASNNNGGSYENTSSDISNTTPYDFAQTNDTKADTTTDVSSDPFADFGSSIEISDDDLPF